MAQPLTIIGPAAVSVALIGCAAGPRGSELVVEQWIRAAERGDCPGMHALLDETVTAALDVEAFTTWCERHRGHLDMHSQQLQRSATESGVQLQARLTISGGRAVPMIIDPDVPSRWRLVESLPLMVGAASPMALLQELSALMESGAMERTLHMMTETMRAEYLAELQLVATALANADEAVVTVDGVRAEISLGEMTIQLRRLDGVWQLESVEQGNYYEYYEGY